MLENQSIICFAHDWDGDPTSKTHIMRILARKNRVLWINSIGMRRPAVSTRDARRIVQKLRAALAGPRTVEPGLHVASPLTLPLPGHAAVDRLNAELLVGWLRWLCRRLGMRRPILWTYMPNVEGLIGRLNERMVIYHCVDEYAEFAGVDTEAIRRLESALVRRADLVLTSSEKLRDERLGLNERTHLVQHGVDLSHFSRALDPATRVPADLDRLHGPVIGFIGLLAEWVDVALVRALAEAHPECSIALVGRVTTDVASLRGLPNVHFLGHKPYADLPGYCRGFDVGIVPFRMNALTLRANPLKLREYLASGLPVVSTPLPEVLRYAPLVAVGGTPQEFIGAVETALRARSYQLEQARVEAMRKESWEARVGEIERLVEAPLSRVA
jgi:glycosyltransferase involved in cell wall biosynthesis